jgi:hypothetical protein
MARSLKALTIRQPWVHAILHLGKDVENRSWSTTYRGPILIHAAKGLTKGEYRGFTDMLADPECAAVLRARGITPACPAFDALPRSGIVGVVDIVDCIAESDSPWWAGPGQFAFVLKNPRPLPFTPWRGQLGFFPVPADALPAEALRAA